MARNRESLERELAQLKANLNRLEEQRAKFGLHVPIYILSEIGPRRLSTAQRSALVPTMAQATNSLTTEWTAATRDGKSSCRKPTSLVSPNWPLISRGK